MGYTIYDEDFDSYQTLSDEKPEVLIGSSPECDIVLHGAEISARQARLYIRGHHRFLDVYEGASVRMFYDDIKVFPPPASIPNREVKPGEYCRIDGRPFRIGQYIVQPVKSIELKYVTAKRMVKK